MSWTPHKNSLTNVNGSGINLDMNIFEGYLVGSYPGLSTQKTLDPDSDLIKGFSRARFGLFRLEQFPREPKMGNAGLGVA